MSTPVAKRSKTPTKSTPEKQILDFAQSVAKQSTNWMQLHNAVYGLGGKFAELFPDRKSRIAFSKSPEFKEVAKLIGLLRKDQSPQVSPQSGKFILRLPESMHAALVAEAEEEGVSLNQLCVAKLAAQLRTVFQ